MTKRWLVAMVAVGALVGCDGVDIDPDESACEALAEESDGTLFALVGDEEFEACIVTAQEKVDGSGSLLSYAGSAPAMFWSSARF